MKKEGRDGPEIPNATSGAQTHGWWLGLEGRKEERKRARTQMREIKDHWREEKILGKVRTTGR